MPLRTIPIVAGLIALSSAAFAGEIAPSASEICPLNIGAQIPAVTVQTASGDAVDLREALTGSPSVLIVYRGGWCPVCTQQFEGIQDAIKPLQDLGISLYAMSVDDPERLVAGRDADSPFTLLSDFELNAAIALGLAFEVEDSYIDLLAQYNLDTAGNAVATQQVLPVPAVYVLDETGIITFSYVNPDYKVRCDPAVLIAAAGALVSQ